MLVGLRTDVGPEGGLNLRQRWGQVALLCGIVFAGRLAIATLAGRRALAAEHRARRPGRCGCSRPAGSVAPALLAAALVLPFIPGIGRYELDIGILVLTYVMLGWGLNIVVGLAGLLDLGYVAFYAIGAYSYACWRSISACPSGSACRWPASSPPSGASCWASRCCGCAATTWRS